MNYTFTSESVTIGHPDKICDYVSDLILDEALKQDPFSKMAVETTIKDDLILIYGEATTNAKIDYTNIALNALKEIGYYEEYHVIEKISKQSIEISQAVYGKDGQVNAGDQGIMFGYACDETDNYMPSPIYYAHKLAKALDNLHKENNQFGPDGKTQVSIDYEEDKVKRINTIIISSQHKKEICGDLLQSEIMNKVIIPTIPKELIDNKTILLINPSGSFIKGGSFGDSGTTGRKIVCDTYGGVGRIGGGCLSSKDPTKVDRSGAYYSRYVAKNIVANNLAKKCEIQVAYAIGRSSPVSIYLNCFNTEKIPLECIYKIIEKNFDFSVKNIINELNLRRPIYSQTSCYGHFGNPDYPWEKIKKLTV